jgi:carboxyl-terminal processing protease
VLPLDDGSAIRLTTAKYYTPSKRLIHDRGIEPDIVVPIPPEDQRKLQIKRSRPENSEPEEGEEDVIDVQLERAVDVLKGIMLFEATDSGQLFASK